MTAKSTLTINDGVESEDDPVPLALTVAQAWELLPCGI